MLYLHTRKQHRPLYTLGIVELEKDLLSKNIEFGLAPMEGVSDFAFRFWLSLCSKPDFQSTPFLE